MGQEWTRQRLPVLQTLHDSTDFRFPQDLFQDFPAVLHPDFRSDLPSLVHVPHFVVLFLLRHGSIVGSEGGQGKLYLLISSIMSIAIANTVNCSVSASCVSNVIFPSENVQLS